MPSPCPKPRASRRPTLRTDTSPRRLSPGRVRGTPLALIPGRPSRPPDPRLSPRERRSWPATSRRR
ncbi:MAG: hypothetical protein C0467_23320 [Planctomycetaceae bacterium]|nr:hypothetical protein [Planctomycetaceae bacterium]